METISQREMRNDSGRILREAEMGTEFTVTRRGTPVARLVPLVQASQGSGPSGVRPARRPAVFLVDDLVTSTVSSEQILADLRDER